MGLIGFLTAKWIPGSESLLEQTKVSFSNTNQKTVLYLGDIACSYADALENGDEQLSAMYGLILLCYYNKLEMENDGKALAQKLGYSYEILRPILDTVSDKELSSLEYLEKTLFDEIRNHYNYSRNKAHEAEKRREREETMDRVANENRTTQLRKSPIELLIKLQKKLKPAKEWSLAFRNIIL